MKPLGVVEVYRIAFTNSFPQLSGPPTHGQVPQILQNKPTPPTPMYIPLFSTYIDPSSLSQAGEKGLACALSAPYDQCRPSSCLSSKHALRPSLSGQRPVPSFKRGLTTCALRPGPGILLHPLKKVLEINPLIMLVLKLSLPK